MRRAVTWTVIGLFVAVLGACASPAATPPDPTGVPATAPPGGASPSGSTAPVPDSPVAGVILSVDSRGLNDVRGFTLRSSSGDLLTFTMGELENGDEFPPGHLVEHQAAAAPVLVFFRTEGGALLAYRIEDAG